MAIKLEDLKATSNDKVYQKTVDEFRQSSLMLDKLIFDDAVNAVGTSTLTYSYTREKVPSLASFRPIGREYEAQESVSERCSTDLKVFGGAFEIDRVLQEASGKSNEVARQIQKKIKAAANLFHYTVINGDADTDNGFDGLDKALRDTKTEIMPEKVIDISSQEEMEKNYKLVLDYLDTLLSCVDGRPAFIMANTSMLTKLKGVARRAGYLTHTEDAFGQQVDCYDKIPFLDMGYFAKKNGDTYEEVPCIPIVTRTVNEVSVTGLTDIYVPVISLDHLHGVTLSSKKGVIKSYLPDFNTPGAVKKGEAEMVASIALKSTRGAGVLRNIKIK